MLFGGTGASLPCGNKEQPPFLSILTQYCHFLLGYQNQFALTKIIYTLSKQALKLTAKHFACDLSTVVPQSSLFLNKFKRISHID